MLWRHLCSGRVDPLRVEESAVHLLAAVVRAAMAGTRPRGERRHSAARRSRQVETVKEALSIEAQRAWTLGEVALLAHSSPCHLARVFAEEVGMPIHRYLLRMRLAQGLAAVVEGRADLSQVALEAGFASHSHFTASFRKAFGLTPSALRQSPLCASA